MTMHVDSKRIRAERARRAWSQEHLAAATDVSLRTIQRVERTGLASYDTAQSVAAVFEIDVSELRVVDPVAPAPVVVAPALLTPAQPTPPVPAAQDARSRGRRYWGLAASLALVAATLFGRVAYAQQVRLDVALAVNEQQLSQHQLVADDGSGAEIRLEGQMKLVVVPTVASDGNIALSIRMYEYADERFALVSEPKLLAADSDEVEVKLTSKRGNVFRIAIKPHKVE